jgi:DNA-binding MarR family transcriptional regulator
MPGPRLSDSAGAAGTPSGTGAITWAYADDQAGTGMTLHSADGASAAWTAAMPAGPAADGDGDGDGRTEPMLLYLVKQVELAVRSRLDDLLRPEGLTALQYTALTVLERHPDLSSAQLARNSFVTAQSMADMITALEGRGLIERHRDKADRRRLVVALTGAGRQVLDRYRGQVNALEEQMLAGFTKARIASLRRSLHACHANLARRSRS